MDKNHPIKECRVQDLHISVVTIEWQDGRTRTLALTSVAYLVNH